MIDVNTVKTLDVLTQMLKQLQSVTSRATAYIGCFDSPRAMQSRGYVGDWFAVGNPQIAIHSGDF